MITSSKPARAHLSWSGRLLNSLNVLPHRHKAYLCHLEPYNCSSQNRLCGFLWLIINKLSSRCKQMHVVPQYGWRHRFCLFGRAIFFKRNAWNPITLEIDDIFEFRPTKIGLCMCRAVAWGFCRGEGAGGISSTIQNFLVILGGGGVGYGPDVKSLGTPIYNIYFVKIGKFYRNFSCISVHHCASRIGKAH